MSKDKIADYDGVTAGNNTDIGGISTAEGDAPQHGEQRDARVDKATRCVC